MYLLEERDKRTNVQGSRSQEAWIPQTPETIMYERTRLSLVGSLLSRKAGREIDHDDILIGFSG